MLKSLNKYKNLGTLNFYIELTRLLNTEQELKKEYVNKYFSNRIIDGKYIFDGWFELLSNIGLIEIDYEGYITASPKLLTSDSSSYVAKVILTSFLEKYSKDESFLNIFSQSNLSFDTTNKSLRIKRYAFASKNINLLDFLLTMGFISEDPDFHDFLIINELYRKEFIELAGHSIRAKKSLEELLKLQEKNRQLGELAERFVINFEQQRISSVEKVYWISPIDTGRGFDILSYDDKNFVNERFIEVKSYPNERKVSFFWSANEMKIAQDNSEIYFLYLVDRSKMHTKGYEPEIIKNPYNFFFEENNWDRNCSNWFFKRN